MNVENCQLKRVLKISTSLELLTTRMLVYDILAVLTALLVILYTWFKWSYQYWKTRDVPYIEPSFPYGNIQSPIRKTKDIGTNIHDLCKEAIAKGWKYFGIYVFNSPIFVPLDPELIKHIMTKDFNQFTDRGVYVNEKDDPLSAHLFAIGGLKWRNLRTKLTPTFTSGKMRMMFQTLADCGNVLEKYVDEQVEKSHNEPFDIKSVLGCFSTDIIGSCAFGLECNTFKEPDSPFRKFGNKVVIRNALGQLKLAFISNFGALSRRLHLKITPDDVEQFFMNIVKKTVEYREKNNVERKDFLQLLIEIKNNKDTVGHQGDGTTLTMDEMAAQSFVFFIAGFETSSTTMTFALFELAINPGIQEKVREELHRVLKKYNNKITYDCLKELEYMGKVIEETLRKYPPLPFISRKCVQDYQISGTNVTVEKGTRVFIPVRALHYNEEYYENPEKFDPDRFNEENKQKRHPYTHIPFGEGPRICIGMRFGIMQSKVGLASILKNHKVTLNKKTKVPLKIAVNSFIPTAEGGMWLDLEKI